MQIIVECSCGKKLKAPAALAGKRAKCSGCGKVLQIPTGNPGHPGTPGHAAPSRSAAKPVRPAPPPVKDSPISLVDDQNDGYALVDETPKPAARPKPASTSPASRPSSSKPARPKDDDDAPFQLTDDLLEPELPVSALVEHAPAASASPLRGAGRGKGTPAAMAAAGMNPALARVASQTSRADHNQGPQPLFNLLGVDFTPVKAIVLLGILLLVLGGGVYYFTGPGKGVRIYDAQPVTTLVSLQSLGRTEIKGLTAMARAQAGQAPVEDGPLGPGFTQNEAYDLGGGERLIFTRPDPNGDHLLVHVKISQRVVAEEKLESGYDTSFGAHNFILHAGQQEIKPRLIMGKILPSELELHNGSARMDNIQNILPAEPDRYDDLEGTEQDTIRATVVYDGSKNITGQVKMQSNRRMFDQPGVTGVGGTGSLVQQDPYTGMTVKYDYMGGTMKISWNGEGTAWWSADQYNRPAAVSPFARFDIYLLYPRPQTTDTMTIKVNNRVIGTLSSSLAGTGAKPSTVATATVPTASTSGNTTTGTTPAKPPSTPEEAAAALAGGPGGVGGQGQGKVGTYDYFGALARARQNAMGIVSENNMKQLGVGILQYAEQNQGKLPPDLDHVRMVLGDINQLLLNVRTGANPGFLYIQPAPNINDVANPAATPILYELRDGKLDRDGAIMYLDGHMEVRK